MGFAAANQPRVCPLCDAAARYREWAPDLAHKLQVECDRCGRFTISEDAMYALQQRPERRYLLSAACRLRLGEQPPGILTTNIEQLSRQVPKFTITEKLDRLLDLVSRGTDRLGGWSTFDFATDYPLIVAQGPAEVEYMAASLIGQSYLEPDRDGHFRITVPGMQRLEQIRASGRESSLCFVAMWFDPSTNELYEQAILPAIREAGYEALRIDRHEHVNRIDDEIVGQIRKSRFMVAEFTGQRHGVYFEAGLMMGLGRNVIWMCDQRELRDAHLHFDVRQYNFIDWTSVADALRRLRHRILAIEGQGPR